ncbi:hypothetical protein [Secundilactobacillus kimchicus]|uniref:hypothetical protein n=1 Tax=Secundilactobacillus kimchicus TaxID=528209 RepID=UPI0024A90B9F|nr:hypothetical protein [Secundilactobacillus kimchicus]
MFKSTEVDLSDEALTEKILNAFPAVMNQEDGSVNQRLLQTIVAIVLSHKNDMLKLASMSDINNMSGGLLAAKAADWGVTRIDDDDDFLRFQVRLAILKSQLGDSMNDFKTLISIALGINPSVFNVVEGNGVESMRIINIPFNFDETKNRKRKQKLFEDTLQEIMPAEYKLEQIQYATNTTAKIFVAVVAQVQRKTYAPVLLGRKNYTHRHIFVATVSQFWRKTCAPLIDRS